jgi:hypothetical protein
MSDRLTSEGDSDDAIESDPACIRREKVAGAGIAHAPV